MNPIKIGKLEMKEYAAKKPLAITPTGEFVTASEIVETPSLAMGSLLALSEDLQVKLTVERNKLEPDYKLGIIGVGIVTKDEVIEHVEAKTEFGLEVVRAELNYCNELMATLAGAEIPKWSIIPKAIPEPIPKDWRWVPKPYRWFVRTCALFCENTTDSITRPAAEYRKKNVHPVFQAKGFLHHCIGRCRRCACKVCSTCQKQESCVHIGYRTWQSNYLYRTPRRSDFKGGLLRPDRSSEQSYPPLKLSDGQTVRF